MFFIWYKSALKYWFSARKFRYCNLTVARFARKMLRLFEWFLDTIFESLKETGKGWCVTLILLSIFYECQVWTTSHFEAIRVVKHHFLRGCPFYHLPDLTTYRVQNMPFIQKHLRNKSYKLYENYQQNI